MKYSILFICLFFFYFKVFGQSVELTEKGKIEERNQYHFADSVLDKYVYIYRRMPNMYEVKSKIDKKYGLIDSLSNEIVPCIYSQIGQYDDLMTLENNDLKGLLNFYGKFLVPVEYTKLSRIGFTNNWIVGKNNLQGVINVSNEKYSILIPIDYNSIGYEYITNTDLYHFIVRKDTTLNGHFNSKYGLFNSQGKFIVPLIYTEFSRVDMRLKLYKVSNAGKSGIIDSNNNIVIPIIFDQLNGFNSKGLTPAKKDKWGLINSKGKFIVEPTYDDMFYYQDNILRVKKNGKTGFLNAKGKLIIPCIYDNANAGYYDNVLTVLLNDKMTILDRAGNEIFPFIYNELGRFEDGFAPAKKNKYYGIIDKKGNVIIPFEYSYIEFDRNCSCFTARKNGTKTTFRVLDRKLISE